MKGERRRDTQGEGGRDGGTHRVKGERRRDTQGEGGETEGHTG